MRTTILWPAIFLSTFILTSACTPRDVAVTPADQRGKIKELANSPGAVKTDVQNPEFPMNTFSLAGFVGQKQIEIIELLQLASGSLDSAKTSFKVEVVEDKGEGAKTLKIQTASPDTALAYANSLGSWKAKSNRSLQIVMASDEDLESLKAIIAPSSSGPSQPSTLKSSVDAVKPAKGYVNLIEKQYVLEVSKSETAGVLEVALYASGEINGLRGDTSKRGVSTFALSLAMKVDAASLKTADVKVLNSNIDFFYLGAEAKINMLQLQGENLLLKMEQNCNRVLGTTRILSDPSTGTRTEFIFDENSFRTSDESFSQSLAPCGTRPVVDLSFLKNM